MRGAVAERNYERLYEHDDPVTTREGCRCRHHAGHRLYNQHTNSGAFLTFCVVWRAAQCRYASDDRRTCQHVSG